MEIVKTVAEMQGIVRQARREGRTVGLVPTMGYFHEGHLELMRRARADCDVVVVSLFVNPTQFGPSEDFAQYPRDMQRDSAMAASVGVDYIFNPEPEEMYPAGHTTHVEVEELSGVMCGASRPGHFRGVATVVAKLFNIVPADRAYFGQKDAQQLVVIRRMARDLDFPVEVIGVPTVREEDGLAMSSRNTYLSPDERSAALVLYRALGEAGRLIGEGETGAAVLEQSMRTVIEGEPLANLEYIAICDNIFLQPARKLSGEVLIALAVRIGSTRLIDNMLFVFD